MFVTGLVSPRPHGTPHLTFLRNEAGSFKRKHSFGRTENGQMPTWAPSRALDDGRWGGRSGVSRAEQGCEMLANLMGASPFCLSPVDKDEDAPPPPAPLWGLEVSMGYAQRQGQHSVIWGECASSFQKQTFLVGCGFLPRAVTPPPPVETAAPFWRHTLGRSTTSPACTRREAAPHSVLTSDAEAPPSLPLPPRA